MLDLEQCFADDRQARLLGAGAMLLGITIGSALVNSAVSEARAHQTMIFLHYGTVTFPVILTMAGLVFLVAGKRGRKYVPSGQEERYTAIQWFTMAIILLTSLGLELAFHLYFRSLGYAPGLL
jgi:hypothetical protein